MPSPLFRELCYDRDMYKRRNEVERLFRCLILDIGRSTKLSVRAR